MVASAHAAKQQVRNTEEKAIFGVPNAEGGDSQPLSARPRRRTLGTEGHRVDFDGLSCPLGFRRHDRKTLTTFWKDASVDAKAHRVLAT